MRRSTIIVLLGLSLSCATASRHDRPAAQFAIAAPRGSLVIVGGGPRGEAITRKFIELAGGPDRARILVLPMASSLPETGPESVEEFKKHGVSAWSMNLTRDEAMRAETRHALDSATGIWFPGGDQVRIMAVLDHTPTGEAIRARYAAGAVIGGTSAGAAVMSTPMLTGDERAPGGARRDTTQSFITIAREDVVLTNGLGLVEGAIIDQHFLRRKRHNRLISVVLEHPSQLAIGIDESTALVIEPGKPWSIIGESAAIVYDARSASITKAGAPILGATNIRMQVLPAGSTFEPGSGIAHLP